MPQFDTFIFASSLLYFITCYLILLKYNTLRVLPKIAAILKLRSKISKVQSQDIDKDNVDLNTPYKPTIGSFIGLVNIKER